MNETLGMDGTLPERMRMMPSSLNDACRTLEAGADEIERLRGVLNTLAAGFEIARDRCTYAAEAKRLDNCAKHCREAALYDV